jgi:hypothetical protein
VLGRRLSLEYFVPFIIIIVIVINSNINISLVLSIKDWYKKYFVLVLYGYKTVIIKEVH